IAFPINVCLMTLLAAKDGASVAYFLEAGALAAWLIAGVGLPELMRFGRSPALATAAVVCLLAVVPAVRAVKRCVCKGSWRAESRAAVELRGALSAGAPGPVLADSHALADVVFVGRGPLVNDPYMVRLLVENGRIPPDAMVQVLTDGSVPYVVLSQ